MKSFLYVAGYRSCKTGLTLKGRNYVSDLKTQLVPRSKHSIPRSQNEQFGSQPDDVRAVQL